MLDKALEDRLNEIQKLVEQKKKIEARLYVLLGMEDEVKDASSQEVKEAIALTEVHPGQMVEEGKHVIFLPNKKIQILELHKIGKTNSEIIQEIGVSRNYIHIVLHEAGLKSNGHSTPMRPCGCAGKGFHRAGCSKAPGPVKIIKMAGGEKEPEIAIKEEPVPVVEAITFRKYACISCDGEWQDPNGDFEAVRDAGCPHCGSHSLFQIS